MVGTPDARKRACPVWGALDGNLLPQDSKALSFDPVPSTVPIVIASRSSNAAKLAAGLSATYARILRAS